MDGVMSIMVFLFLFSTRPGKGKTEGYFLLEVVIFWAMVLFTQLTKQQTRQMGLGPSGASSLWNGHCLPSGVITVRLQVKGNICIKDGCECGCCSLILHGIAMWINLRPLLLLFQCVACMSFVLCFSRFPGCLPKIYRRSQRYQAVIYLLML